MSAVFAEGYAISKAVSQPTRPIVIFGVWLFALPMILLLLESFPDALRELIQGVSDLQPGQILGALVCVTIMSIFMAIYAAIVYKATRNYLRENQKPKASIPETGMVTKPSPSGCDDRLTCLACGQTIPEHEKQCPICGWTWHGASDPSPIPVCE
jgi:hypothetical protein